MTKEMLPVVVGYKCGVKFVVGKIIWPNVMEYIITKIKYCRIKLC